MKNVSRIFLNHNGKVRNTWWIAIFFLMLFLILFPAIILSHNYGFDITHWHQAIIILAASVVCQRLRRQPLNELTGKINYEWLKELSYGIIAGAILMALPAAMLKFSGAIQWQVNDFSLLPLIQGVMAMAGVVIAEELLFRGFIFQRLIAAWGKWPAQIIVAGLFLLTHLNNPGMTGTIKVLASANIFIASLLFGIAYIKTKSLAMPLGIHFMANIMQGTVLGFGVSGGKEYSILTPVFSNLPDWFTGGMFGLEASVFGLFILLVLTAACYYWTPAKVKAERNI